METDEHAIDGNNKKSFKGNPIKSVLMIEEMKTKLMENKVICQNKSVKWVNG
jgi:hypothetical protein